MRTLLFISLLMISNSNLANDILPISKGLTLAEIKNHKHQVLAVLKDNGDYIEAINLSQLTKINGSAIEVYNKLGPTRITEIINKNRASATSPYQYSQLLSPAGEAKHHIAIGFNYPKHAGEVSANNKPFLFLKETQATRTQPIKTSKTKLLDYEVELCARALKNLTSKSNEPDLSFGYFLCGDFTDRATLLREMNLDNIQSGEGFSHAKSFTGYFPTGPYLVIPKNNESFLKSIELQLYLNQQLKQQAKVADMTWTLSETVKQVFKNYQQKIPTYANIKEWLPEGKLTDKHILLTGTPDGVIMRAPSLWFKLKAAVIYFFSTHNKKHENVKRAVIDQYIEHLLKERSFLQTNDQLILKATYLGSMQINITSSD